MTINDSIHNAEVRHMVFLERYKKGVADRITALTNKSEKDLRTQLAVRLSLIEERGYDLSPTTTARLEKMIDELVAIRAEVFALAHDETRKNLKEFAVYEAEFQGSLIEKASDAAGVKVKLETPSLTLLRAAAVSRPFQGRILKDWYAGLEANDARRLRDAIKIGVSESQTTEQIMQRVMGTRAANFRDGILEMARNEVRSVVQTAIAHVANQASDEVFKANADIIKGVQWVSVLDSKTSPICRVRDGKIYPVDSGPRPPAHFNCRSRVVPYLGPSETVGTRASQFGPVPQDLKYGDWLKKQPKALQNEILGPTRAALFRKGGLTLDRFIDNTGRSYTLDELKQRDGAAWHKAFPDG